MGDGLLVFAVVMACLAVCVTLYCLVAEAGEAWEIRRRGWVQGHRLHERHAIALPHVGWHRSR